MGGRGSAMSVTARARAEGLVRDLKKMGLKTKSVDEAVEEAISRNSVKLINSIAKSAQSGDFESCKKTLKVLDQIQKRRRR